MPCHASLNRTCIILDCASCHVYACVFTILFASFWFASLVSFGFIPELWGSVRVHPFVLFMASFFFLAGLQARWPLPSISLLSLLASCFVLSLCCATYHLLYHASQIAMSASNLFTLPSKPLFGYVTARAQPSYSVVSWRWSRRLIHDGQDYVGISQYLLFKLMHLYTW